MLILCILVLLLVAFIVKKSKNEYYRRGCDCNLCWNNGCPDCGCTDPACEDVCI